MTVAATSRRTSTDTGIVEDSLLTPHRFDVSYEDICPVPTAIYRQIGYEPGKRPGPRIAGMVAARLDEAAQIARPAISAISLPIDATAHDHVIVDGTRFDSAVLAGLLAGSSEAIAFAMTVGPEIESLSRELSANGASFDAMVVDAIGSTLVQKLVRHLQTLMRKRAESRGMVASRRFCPGYCDWHVNGQAGLFGLLRGETAGIRLTESLLMIPHKSMSGIVGMGIPGSQQRNYVPCANCQMRDCIGRG